MKLQIVKELFADFLNKFPKEELKTVMNFLEFAVDEYNKREEKALNYLLDNNQSNEKQQESTEIQILNNIKQVQPCTSKHANKLNRLRPVIVLERSKIAEEKLVKTETVIPLEDNQSIKEELEDSKEYYENLTEDEYENNENEGINLCLVCGFRPSLKQIYEADVCYTCYRFFLNAYSGANFLKCRGSNNCKMIKNSTRNCRKCRFKKCLKIGMIYPSGSKYLNKTCPVCKTVDKRLGVHYGIVCCISCAKFYSKYRNDDRSRIRSEKSKCINGDYNCDKRASRFSLVSCNKCRLNKLKIQIQKL